MDVEAVGVRHVVGFALWAELLSDCEVSEDLLEVFVDFSLKNGAVSVDQVFHREVSVEQEQVAEVWLGLGEK